MAVFQIPLDVSVNSTVFLCGFTTGILTFMQLSLILPSEYYNFRNYRCYLLPNLPLLLLLLCFLSLLVLVLFVDHLLHLLVNDIIASRIPAARPEGSPFAASAFLRFCVRKLEEE